MAHNRSKASKRLLMAVLDLYNIVRPLAHRLEDATWRWRGSPLPAPPPVKQRTVRDYAQRFALDTLVETGTYLGAMVQNTHDLFARIVSIELDDHLWKRAQRRFAHYANVTILHGNSAQVLPGVVATLDRPTLFWLDAHYSGDFTARGPQDTPIMKELEIIFDHRLPDGSVPGHVLLIDDARVFDGTAGYPELTVLQSLLLAGRPGWQWKVETDIIRFHPQRA